MVPPIRSTPSNQTSSHGPRSSTITTTKVPVVITQITPISSNSGHASKFPVRATSALKPSTLVTVLATPQQHQWPKSLPTTTTNTSTTSMATPLHNVSNSETVPSPSHSPVDPTKEMNGVLEKLKESSVPSELTSFLELFQKGVNECLDFFKNKVTDPNSGLETKVTDLHTDVNALSSRVMVLENRESSHTVSTSASSKVPNSKIKEIENQLSEAEFNTQMLIHWADNM